MIAWLCVLYYNSASECQKFGEEKMVARWECPREAESKLNYRINGKKIDQSCC